MLTPLHKTHTDSQGRNYFLYECTECKAQLIKRTDHVSHKCKKVKPKIDRTITKTILIAPKKILYAEYRPVVITAKNKTAYAALIADIKKGHLVKNDK